MLARFDAERQALALMDHPNIARIYDGGLTPAGQPFFVMELVKGVPLTEYCDQQRLSVKARLELFVAVCQAVQHAHQKGIIHRDLKPGNVLVTEVDGRPTPKVIDFGVAKATEVKLTDMSLADVGAIVGTPAYMSPEQADPTSMDIDTRTDVYALGVMLYELLTGSPPIDAKQFQRGAILEMLRMVREVDPPRPSTKLSTAEALPNIAANRSIEPARLAKLLQGELDWVVMKALEKDRTRRYETANGFARDIQRYLADEVVEARPPSRGYRLKKFVKRNKGQVIAASLVFLTSGRRDRRAPSLRDGDPRRARQQRGGSRTACQGGRPARQGDRLRNQGPRRGRQDPGDQRLPHPGPAHPGRAGEQCGGGQGHAPGSPRPRGREGGNAVRGPAGTRTIPPRDDRDDLPRPGVLGKGRSQVRAVLDAARQRDPRSAEAYRAQGYLAHILYHRGRRDAEVLEMAEAAAKGLERTLGPDHPDTLTTLNHLATAYRDAGKLPEAIALLERVRDAQIATLGPDHPDTLTTLNNLAVAYQDAGRLPEAIALLERVRDARIAKLGPDHPDTLTTLDNLAVAYQAAGRLPEAIALLERVRDARIAKLGPDHPDTLTTLNNLARAYQAVGRLPEAIALLERVRDAQIAKLGPDHPDTLTTLNNLALAYQDAGRLPEAIALFERVRDAQIAKLGPDHPDTLTTLNNLATAYWSTKQLDKSVPLFEDVLKRQEAKLGRQHPDTQMTVANLGVNYKDAGRLKEAIPLLEEAHQAAKTIPAASLGRRPIDRRLCEGGRERQARRLAPGATGRGSQNAAQGQPATGRPARPDRSEPPATEEMDRGRAAPPRVPGHPREDAARCLVHLQHEVAARRRLAGPEEIRRSRAAACWPATRG